MYNPAGSQWWWERNCPSCLTALLLHGAPAINVKATTCTAESQRWTEWLCTVFRYCSCLWRIWVCSSLLGVLSQTKIKFKIELQANQFWQEYRTKSWLQNFLLYCCLVSGLSQATSSWITNFCHCHLRLRMGRRFCRFLGHNAWSSAHCWWHHQAIPTTVSTSSSTHS